MAWFFFSIVTGAAFTLAAAAVDRLAYFRRQPRRFVWLTAMVVTTCWPAIAIGWAALFSVGDASAAIFPLPTLRLRPLVISAPDWRGAAHWESALLIAWALLSTMLLVRIVLAIRTIRRHRNTWRPIELNGTRVEMAVDAGPAVIGLKPMRVVLPEWILDLEPTICELVIRHESEHRTARDPYLLLCATLLTAVFPWNLPLWLQSRRLRSAIELDCDARVLRTKVQWREYAAVLLTIAERQRGSTQSFVPALSERTSHLERRITTMSTTPKLSAARAIYLGLAAIAAFVLACAVDKPQSPDAPGALSMTTAQKSASVSPQVVDGAGKNFFEFQVEKPATLISSPKVSYPARMAHSGIKGDVLAQFVVNEAGRVEMSSLKVLNTTGPDFTASVKATLPMAQFEPAVVGGRKVKQLVQQVYEFSERR